MGAIIRLAASALAIVIPSYFWGASSAQKEEKGINPTTIGLGLAVLAVLYLAFRKK